MIFYNNVEFSSQPVIFITMMTFINMIMTNFIKMRNFHQIYEFSSQCRNSIILISWHQNDEASSQRWIFITMINFDYSGIIIFSSQFWMLIEVNSFHQIWIFITLINFKLSEKFIKNLKFHQLMNFHQDFELSSWLWSLDEIMNFHNHS